MDLRVQKTRKSILNAFITLRAKKELEKITVKELAESAMINKATFYQHYRDIYDLSEQLEEEVLDTTMKSIPHPEYILTRPREGLGEVIHAMTSQSELFSILFSGKRRILLAEKLETSLKKKIGELFPEYIDTPEKDIILTVLIQGMFHAFSSHTNSQPDYVIQVLGNINECLLTNYRSVSTETNSCQ